MPRHHPILWLAVVALVGAVFMFGLALRPTGASVHRNALPLATPATLTASAALSSPDGPVPASIRATVRRGRLAVTLTVSPVDVGPARFVAMIREGDRLVSDARVRLRLAMPAQPVFGAALIQMIRHGASYRGHGTLQALGRWRADVLVRRYDTPSHASGVSAVPFDVMNGANARFLFAQPPDTRFGPAIVALDRAADGSSLLKVRLRPGLAVRAVLLMPNMRSMGTAIYTAAPLSRGWYEVSLAFPMTGVTQVGLEVRVGSGWHVARTLLYDVDSSGHATLLTNTPVLAG